MADIYIYSSLPLWDARGSLEDDIAEYVNGVEVTGGGGGSRGWNIDLEAADADLPKVIPRLLEFLRAGYVPPDTHFDVIIERRGKMSKTRYDVFGTPEVMEWIKSALTFLADRFAANPSGWQSVKADIQTMLAELEKRPTAQEPNEP